MLHSLNVALIGLGKMGVPIAERILSAGHALTVYNRTPGKSEDLVARGASAASAPDKLLGEAEACITVVADDVALEDVTNRLFAEAGPSSVLVDMSTVSVEASSRVAAAADAVGAQYLRAPVSGNPGVVRAGNLTIIVSGPAEVFARMESLLRAIGPNVYHVGESEQARVVKLALQAMIAGTAEMMSEALVLGEAGGVSRDKLLEVMGNSAVGSPFVKYKTGPLLEDDYSATFTTSMMKKDLGFALAFAQELGISLPMTRELEELVQSTVEAGFGDLDLMALFLHLRQQTGLPA